ncbi:hypothetical protein [Bufonid herpesvirus 1]|uniref:hypothetical protein n=1 Tax=Bufonid herpesvirus 1 TaxID=2282206 RepID=UPI000EB70577|nr:hypothetical protein [Bufonid herpesvirus 1]AXF48566.1 hypothetical protein [Bufonid herpesvirus 1]
MCFASCLLVPFATIEGDSSVLTTPAPKVSLRTIEEPVSKIYFPKNASAGSCRSTPFSFCTILCLKAESFKFSFTNGILFCFELPRPTLKRAVF